MQCPKCQFDNADGMNFCGKCGYKLSLDEKLTKLNRDLAELYEVERKRLKEQVKRNLDRFPVDFIFELTKEDISRLRHEGNSQVPCNIDNKG